MRGQDGWRWASIQWASGNRHQSRRIHYFERGWSLCGAHSDINGIYKPKENPPKHLLCKKCQRKVASK